MTTRLVNRSGSLKIVPLNSGQTIILAPGEKSGPILDLEIVGNGKIAKLTNYGDLAVIPEENQ
jgi:hypothetical protein